MTYDDMVALLDIITKVSEEIDLSTESSVNVLSVRGGDAIHMRRSEVDAIRRLIEAVDNGDPAVPFYDCGGGVCQQHGRYCDGCAERDSFGVDLMRRSIERNESQR